jgi:hypothetical protein
VKRWLCCIILGLAICPSASSDGQKYDESGFVYARIRFHMNPYMRGGINAEGQVPWEHDYPFSDELFPSILKETTSVFTTPMSYQIVDIDSPELFRFPFAYLCEPGFLQLTEKDAANLRQYLDRGGFIMVDDFRQYRALQNLAEQMKLVYPDRDIAPLDIKHEVFHTFYEMNEQDLHMPPPYGYEPVQFLGLSDSKGNLKMVILYNNDLSEFWEWLDKGQRSLHDAATSLKFGINFVIYAMTH